MSKQHLGEPSTPEKLPYGTFSNSQLQSDYFKSDGIEAGIFPAEVPINGQDPQLLQLSVDSDPEPDFDFRDTTNLIVDVDEAPSKKDVDQNRITVPNSRFLAFLIQYRGIALALLTSLSVSLASFVTKYVIEEGYSATICLFWRSPIILVVGIFEILYHTAWVKKPIFDTIWPCKEGENRKAFIASVLCRGVLGPLGVLTQFYAFTYIELGDAQTIVYSNAVFVTFFAHFMLGEKWGVVPFLAAIVTILGVMIISKPPFITGSEEEFKSERTYGIVLALCAMMLNTFIFILLRFLRNVHSSISISVMAFFTMILGLAMSLGNNEFDYPHQDLHIAAFFALAGFTCIGAITFTLSLQYEEAGLVALIRCADVVFSFFWQMFLGVYPDEYSIGGTVIVLFCIFIVFFRKYLSSLPPESCLVKYLWFLLK